MPWLLASTLISPYSYWFHNCTASCISIRQPPAIICASSHDGYASVTDRTYSTAGNFCGAINGQQNLFVTSVSSIIQMIRKSTPVFCILVDRTSRPSLFWRTRDTRTTLSIGGWLYDSIPGAILVS